MAASELLDSSNKTPIRVNVIESSQYPWNKKVPFKVIIRVNVPVNSVYITANAEAGEFNPSEYVLNNVRAGTYTIKLNYIPKEQGTITYSVTATAATTETNYADTYNGYMEFDPKLVRIPVTTGYLAYVFGGLLLGVLFLILIAMNVNKVLVYLRDRLIPKLIEKQARQGI